MFTTKRELRKTIEYLRDQRQSEQEIIKTQEDIIKSSEEVRKKQEEVIQSYMAFVSYLKLCIENDEALLKKFSEYVDPVKMPDFIANMDRLLSEYREGIIKGEAGLKKTKDEQPSDS